MSQVKRKGFFLVFSLGVLVLLSLFCLGLGFRTYIQTRTTKLFLNKQRAFYLAVSGVKIARKVLEEDARAVDHLQEDWAKSIDEDIKFSSPEKEGTLSIRIEDESARINVNIMAEKMFIEEREEELTSIIKLFESRGVENAKEKIFYILDYIDEGYEPRLGNSDSKDEIKNDELSVQEELLLVKNISGEDYDKIKDFITVFGDGKMNINTVTEEMLGVLVNEQLKRQILTKRYGANFIEGDEDDEYYDTGSLVNLKDTYKPEKPDDKEQLEGFAVSSHFFRIISEADVEGVKKKITCVMNKDSGKILYWYEE
ncbi:MAG: general secretion pathway protein GspK [Candidatus Omnitrophota bacterium]|nr:MAG: general secretion pathway protein GspK [Candidatus Omnitrophota bacterium]